MKMRALILDEYEASLVFTALRERIDQLRQYRSWIEARPNMPLQQRAIDEITSDVDRHYELLSKMHDQVRT